MFIYITESAGLAITSANTMSATFADYDRDEDLDLEFQGRELIERRVSARLNRPGFTGG